MSQATPSFTEHAALFGSRPEGSHAPGALGADAGVTAQPVDFAELSHQAAHPALNSLNHLLDVTVTVTAELGRVTRSIGEILKLGAGAVVELDRQVAEPVDLLVQGVRVARGEVVVVQGRFAIRITELVDQKKR
jgi:flagellar motor switch protein FliN